MALGYDRIDLLSASYGTHIAQYYAALLPEAIHRSLMIAVNPPGRMVWEPEMLDRQLEYLSGLCAQNPECSSLTSDLAGNHPHREQRHAQTVAVPAHRPRQGKARRLRDDVGHAPRLRRLGGQRLHRRRAGRRQRPGGLPPELRQPRPSGVETLLVSGSIDLSTPAPYATDELLPSLANGEQVILSEFGHLDFYTPPEAFERLALSFLNRGEADISLYEAKTFTFDPALNFPMIGKLIAAAIVGIPLLLVAIVLFVVWRVRRRRRSAQAGPAIS